MSKKCHLALKGRCSTIELPTRREKESNRIPERRNLECLDIRAEKLRGNLGAEARFVQCFSAVHLLMSLSKRFERLA